MIELKNIDVIFSKGKTVHAVNDVSLTVEKGDIYGIVGFSGAGKSTLIRTINLLQRPTSGSVIISGENLTEFSPEQLRQKRQKIGMIFQHFNLLSSKTVFDNVAFPLKHSKLSKEEKAAKVRELLHIVGIGDKEKSYPSQLSGGQKQRVAIARALANDPDILLCDEATSALDPQTTDEVLRLLKNLNEKMNLTIVIITHEMQVVKEICHKVAVMEKGEIIERGNIVDVFSAPEKPLTRSFINTATQIDSALEKVLSHKSLLNLKDSDILARINYVGESTSHPMISTLNNEYSVSTNILSGSIEILQGTPIGSLVVAFCGTETNINRAMDYLRSQQVGVEIIDKSRWKRVTFKPEDTTVVPKED